MTETQKAIEAEANNRYGSLLDIKVIGQYEAKEVVQNCINAFIAGGKWVMDEFEAGRSKSLEEKDKEISDLKKEVEKWKDEYGAMEKIIADYQVMNTKLAGARDLIFHYWRKEHIGVPSFRIQDEWELYKSENNL